MFYKAKFIYPEVVTSFMELIASTKIRREMKHEVYMKTKKSMELSKWYDFIGEKVIVNNIFDGGQIPGRSVSPWVLESIFRIIKEKFPDGKIYVVNPDWPKVCKKYAKVLKKMPKERRDFKVINVAVAKYGAERILKESPDFMVVDATICWSGGAKVCDAIISSGSIKSMSAIINRLYGKKSKRDYKLIGELPKIKLIKEGFLERLFAKKNSKSILRHPLYSQEFN